MVSPSRTETTGPEKLAAITNSVLSQVIDKKARTSELQRLTRSRRVSPKTVDQLTRHKKYIVTYVYTF